MAASSLGSSNSQILSLKLTQKTKSCMPCLPRVILAQTRPNARRLSGITLPKGSKNALIVSCIRSPLVTETDTDEPVASRLEEEGEQRSISSPLSQLIPNSDEVKSLLTEICDTKSIAEFELKLNGFQLRVTRDLAQSTVLPPPPPSPTGSASIGANTADEISDSNGSVSTSLLAISRAGLSEWKTENLLERASDVGLVIIHSPKVGFFRRSRTIKGKRAPPSCKENQIVKEGQVICYIEQLGGEIPVESDVSGEVTKILCNDGDPVGYGDPIIAILPSFHAI